MRVDRRTDSFGQHRGMAELLVITATTNFVPAFRRIDPAVDRNDQHRERRPRPRRLGDQ